MHGRIPGSQISYKYQESAAGVVSRDGKANVRIRTLARERAGGARALVAAALAGEWLTTA
jgi:hypothetical protein